MGYYFKKDSERYFSYIRGVLSWKLDILDFIHYYILSFEKMCLLTLENVKFLIQIKRDNFIPHSRLKYYDDKDNSFIRFYSRIQNKNFTFKELSDYIKEENLFRPHLLSSSISTRLQKHIKDNLVKEVDTWKYISLIINV